MDLFRKIDIILNHSIDSSKVAVVLLLELSEAFNAIYCPILLDEIHYPAAFQVDIKLQK